ncbi:APC family permease [Salicibibacter cibarius]|uniref:APC family permease n=1 Tax=Salicibibacter cibarius TaxID=2743000 RepID=A0A7T6Z3T1_9BACI|nr:APC family permease [Salicibibacter cibarius]QQK76500.1 APC family permease [Salicibibacter cibarius]
MGNGVELQRKLGFFSVFVIGLSLLTPATVFTIFGIASQNTNGHVPAVYLFSVIAILFTVLSYTHMVKVFPRSGSAYTYVQQTFHPNLGFLVGWGALLDYLFLPMVYVLSVAIYMVPLYPNVPEWVWIVGTLAIITLSNIFSVKVAVSFSTLLIALQVLIAGIFIALLINFYLVNEGAATLFSLAPFYTEEFTLTNVFAGSVILAYTFVGFDAISTLAEETIEPKKNIPRAMIALVLFLGVLYTTITYFMQRAFPDVTVFATPDSAVVEIAIQVGGMFFNAVFTGIVIAATFVGGIAAQLGTSRLLYAMGRDNVFPKKIFGYLHPKSHIPIFNILATGVASLPAIFITLDTASSVISFGAFTAFTAVNLCVIYYFLVKRKRKDGKALILFGLFPSIGIAFLAVMWYNIEPLALTLGIAWNLLGVCFLIYITRGFKKTAPSLDFNPEETTKKVKKYDDSVHLG